MLMTPRNKSVAIITRDKENSMNTNPSLKTEYAGFAFLSILQESMYALELANLIAAKTNAIRLMASDSVIT